MNISSLIEVFRMTELKPQTRINLITKLGSAINDSMAMNITEPIVEELVTILSEEIKQDEKVMASIEKL